MSALHQALGVLRPKDFADVPLDDLPDFLHDIFRNAELIANSVPPPPGGDSFYSSRRSRSDANGATCAAEITNSPARPPAPDPAHTALQDSWGKQLKINARDNVLGVSVYKMAGNDRHGAWFARRSVHEGLGFTKWKKAMQQEFLESLAVQGGPGEGNVRGIGSDKRVERRKVDRVGTLEVYQLSAQFPGPTAPREFVTMLLTSDSGLSDSSAPQSDFTEVPRRIPRHWMVVSIPVTHPDAPPRNGLIRGQYESVELIREIPLPPSNSASKSASDSNLLRSATSPTRPRGHTVATSPNREKLESNSLEEAEMNPIEWIMVTRSDPGGGIPRFMVERGTPSSIAADAAKFLDWACAKDEDELAGEPDSSEPPEELHVRTSMDSRKFSVVESNAYLAGVGDSIADKPTPAGFERSRSDEPSVDTKAPRKLHTTLRDGLPRSPSMAARGDDSDSSSDTSSVDSFASAEMFPPSDSPPNTAVSPGTPGIELNHDVRFERALAKIASRKQQLDDRLSQSRQKEEAAAQHASARDDREVVRARERHARELKKREDKHQKEVRKLEERREKEARKLDERRRKEADKNAIARAQRERDEARAQVEVARRENAILKDQVGELQRENTALVARLGKTDVGVGLLQQVKAELASSSEKSSLRARGDSVGSRSNRSAGSAQSKLSRSVSEDVTSKS